MPRRILEASTYALLSFEEEIANEVLAAHVAGYSTTKGDLLHDLKP